MTQPESAGQSVHDGIVEMLANDTAIAAAVKSTVLEALVAVVGESEGDTETNSAETFLTSIEVTGFRGIGPASRP